MKNKSTFFQIIVWSAISAAFIGPGTVTTALKAGSLFGFDLLWAVLFSIIACYVLQETVSRITIASNLSLGEAINLRTRKAGFFNAHKTLVFTIIFGCAAYQAGNLAGAAKGLQIVTDTPTWIVILGIYLIAFLILYSGKMKIIAGAFSGMVVLMALIFTLTVLKADLIHFSLIKEIFTPKMPANSGLLIISLIGTTIVPYNLFLGSSLSKGKELGVTRIGLFISIFLGGIITGFILMTGSLITSPFSFEKLTEYLVINYGSFAANGFGIGLFAAGLTSALTAPFAAALTYNSLFKDDKKNQENRWVWISVLSFGALLASLNYSPVVIIILAQAFNGLILPFVSVYIFYIINDKGIIKETYRNGLLYNLLTIAIVIITIFLGLFHFLKVLFELMNLGLLISNHILITGITTIVVTLAVILLNLAQRK